jgi:hypothetical protein
MTYYKIMHLPSSEYTQSLVDNKDRRKGTIDSTFPTKEEAKDKLRAKLIYEAEYIDVDEPVFMWCHYEIEEHEGDPPENPIIYNRILKEDLDKMSVKELMESSKISRQYVMEMKESLSN